MSGRLDLSARELSADRATRRRRKRGSHSGHPFPFHRHPPPCRPDRAAAIPVPILISAAPSNSQPLRSRGGRRAARGTAIPRTGQPVSMYLHTYLPATHTHTLTPGCAGPPLPQRLARHGTNVSRWSSGQGVSNIGHGCRQARMCGIQSAGGRAVFARVRTGTLEWRAARY